MSIYRCINRIWSLHTMEYHSAVERNEALTPAKMEMNLENMMLSERNQTQKITYRMMPPPPCLSPVLCLNSKQRLHAKQNRRVQR